MPIGVSTACFYPEETEKSLRHCGETGAKVTEIFLNAPSELEESFVRELIRIQGGYGIQVRSVHPFTSATEPYMLFSGYRRRFEDGRELYRRYAETAARLGARYVIMHGDRIAKSLLSVQEYTERFLTINRDMQEFGVTLTQENVNAFRASSPDFISKMRECSGDTVSFTFDVKQAVRAGYTPWAVLEAMGERVVHVHLSDHGKEGDCLIPLTGAFDFAKLFSHLQNVGYEGAYVIELYRSAFSNIEELSESMHKLNDIFHYTLCR